MSLSKRVRRRTLQELSNAPHSVLITTLLPGGSPACLIFGIALHASMYAELQPVLKMLPMQTWGSRYAVAIRVPVVSLTSATTSTGTC